MLTDFQISFLGNFFRFLPIVLFIWYFLNILLESQVKGYVLVLHILTMSLFIGVCSSLVFELDSEGWLTTRSTIATMLIIYVIVFAYPSIVYKSFSLKLITIIQFLFFISTSIMILADGLTNLNTTLASMRAPLPNIISSLIVFPFVMIPYALILKRINITQVLSRLFRSRKHAILVFVASLAIINIDIPFDILLPKIKQNYPYFFPTTVLLICLLALAFTAFYQQTKLQTATQAALLLQQDSYVQTLEEIQGEMRILQHDYKNMLSGLYLQAEAGGADKIQNYLAETLQHFDGNLSHQIMQTTQIRNIKIVELKSLVLAKLVAMEQLGIPFNLEVIAPVERIAMDLTSLNRCIGILLDNALEATQQLQQYAPVTLAISVDKNDVTFIIKNTIIDTPPLQQLHQRGFSTKPTNSGLGLFSLQQIIGKYSNVFKQTIVADSTFTQIITIQS